MFGSETCEHIIVFSDEYYQKNCVKADGANMAVMMNIPENYDKVVEEIKAYAKDHSQVNYFDVDNGNLIYEKKELLLERSKTKLLYVASAAGNIIIMLLCGIFVLSIKMECDFPETEWKYRFYIQSGMSSATVPDDVSEIEVAEILKKAHEDKDVYKDGYCPYTLLNYICEKQGWLFSEFPFDVELDFK